VRRAVATVMHYVTGCNVFLCIFMASMILCIVSQRFI
jgi:hypothetical protein